MSLRDYLKNSIPEFQQIDSPLTGYLDAAGSFLDETKEAITQFDYHRDWRKGSELSVDMTTKQRGFDLPSNMAYEAKRVFLRDIAEVIKRNGTEDGLLHALKMIGYNADVRPAWIPCAERLEEGYLVDIVNGIEKYYELDRRTYRDFLYGEAVVTENGVYFEGHKYIDDALEQNKVTGIPISGEMYDEFAPNNISVTKSPYVAIRLKNGDFNVDVREYTNPITGKVYSYSADEEFKLVNDIIEYFIKSGYRATTIRAIIVAFLQQFDDEFSISETFNDSTYYDSDGGDDIEDSVLATDPVSQQGTVLVNGEIGGNMITGSEIPFASPISIVRSIPIGTNSLLMPELYFWSAYTRVIPVSLNTQTHDILVRYNTSIEVENTSSVDIRFIANDNLVQVIQPLATFGLTTNHLIHKIRLDPVVFVEESVNVVLHFKQFNQQGEVL